MVGFARLLGCYIIIINNHNRCGCLGGVGRASFGFVRWIVSCWCELLIFLLLVCVCALRLPSCASMWGVVLGCLSYHLSIACSSSLAFWICVAIVCNVWLFDQYSVLADLLGSLVHFACFCFQDLVACSYLFFLLCWACLHAYPLPHDRYTWWCNDRSQCASWVFVLGFNSTLNSVQIFDVIWTFTDVWVTVTVSISLVHVEHNL